MPHPGFPSPAEVADRFLCEVGDVFGDGSVVGDGDEVSGGGDFREDEGLFAFTGVDEFAGTGVSWSGAHFSVPLSFEDDPGDSFRSAEHRPVVLHGDEDDGVLVLRQVVERHPHRVKSVVASHFSFSIPRTSHRSSTPEGFSDRSGLFSFIRVPVIPTNTVPSSEGKSFPVSGSVRVA